MTRTPNYQVHLRGALRAPLGPPPPAQRHGGTWSPTLTLGLQETSPVSSRSFTMLLTWDFYCFSPFLVPPTFPPHPQSFLVIGTPHSDTGHGSQNPPSTWFLFAPPSPSLPLAVRSSPALRSWNTLRRWGGQCPVKPLSLIWSPVPAALEGHSRDPASQHGVSCF